MNDKKEGLDNSKEGIIENDSFHSPTEKVTEGVIKNVNSVVLIDLNPRFDDTYSKFLGLEDYKVSGNFTLRVGEKADKTVIIDTVLIELNSKK